MELAEWRFSRHHESSGDGVLIRYLDWCRTTRGHSAETVRSYTSTLGAWAEWQVDVLSATRQDMEAFLERPRERRGKGRMGSPATRRREASCLRAFYAWAADEGLVDSSPAARLVGPTVHNTNPRPVGDDAWTRIWGSDQLTDGERMLLGLGFFCGLRRAEMLHLRSEQITNTRIRDFVRKGGGESTFPWAEVVGVYGECLPQTATGDVEAFSRLMHRSVGKSGLVLPWVIEGSEDPNTINKRLCLVQKRLDIPEREWVTPHQLRHSFATNLLRAGVPLHLVSALCNHSSTAITMRYVKAGGLELREWRKRLSGEGVSRSRE